ncbi:MAG: hypothetical protein HY376_02995 [Candidatus Blackburnbacteria bacterium]|nr:hypothetical protein [Candidatus Blackburnbacteria bacterium]
MATTTTYSAKFGMSELLVMAAVVGGIVLFIGGGTFFTINKLINAITENPLQTALIVVVIIVLLTIFKK